jgi:hypothetical protein
MTGDMWLIAILAQHVPRRNPLREQRRAFPLRGLVYHPRAVDLMRPEAYSPGRRKPEPAH